MGRIVKGPFGSFGWIGEEGEDCPICKAHGIHPDEPGPILLPILAEELLQCPCPLCATARFEPENN